MELNKSLLKKLKKQSDKEVITLAYSCKCQNRVQDSLITKSKRFQTGYNTVLFELKERNLLR